MTTRRLRVGIASHAEFKARTMAIARGELVPAPGDPTLWFPSMESLSRILSDRNRALLAMIAQGGARSLAELAARSGRAPSNLSRTLKTMEFHGLVAFEPGQGRARVPRVSYSCIELAMPLAPVPAASRRPARPGRQARPGRARAGAA
jgi:predicted transcriptional regulator